MSFLDLCCFSGDSLVENISIGKWYSNQHFSVDICEFSLMGIIFKSWICSKFVRIRSHGKSSALNHNHLGTDFLGHFFHSHRGLSQIQVFFGLP